MEIILLFSVFSKCVSHVLYAYLFSILPFLFLFFSLFLSLSLSLSLSRTHTHTHTHRVNGAWSLSVSYLSNHLLCLLLPLTFSTLSWLIYALSSISSTFYKYSKPHYLYICIIISSSCCTISTDIPDPFSPPLPIIHCFWQVLRNTPRILTELLYVGSSWSPCFCSAV